MPSQWQQVQLQAGSGTMPARQTSLSSSSWSSSSSSSAAAAAWGATMPAPASVQYSWVTGPDAYAPQGPAESAQDPWAPRPASPPSWPSMTNPWLPGLTPAEEAFQPHWPYSPSPYPDNWGAWGADQWPQPPGGGQPVCSCAHKPRAVHVCVFGCICMRVWVHVCVFGCTCMLSDKGKRCMYVCLDANVC